MPSRRNDDRDRGAAAIATGVAAAIGLRLWAKAARRPLDSLALLGAVAVSLAIIVNAVLLQKGARPAPFFFNPPPAAESRRSAPAMVAPKPAATAVSTPVPASSPVTARAPQTVAARRNDPIADLIAASSRLAAAQRVLAQFGYGQIKPSGNLDEATRAAIMRFERDHQLPVTGRLSDRLLGELAAMAGHPIE